jgi:hypothetical protein
MLISAWRQQYYDSDRPTEESRANRKLRGLPAENWISENELLLEFDLGYRLRRIAFVRDLIQGLTGLERSTARPGDAPARPPHPQSPRYSVDRAREILRGARLEDSVAGWQTSIAVSREYQDALRKVALALKEMYRELRKIGRGLRARDDSSPLRPALTSMQISHDE